VIVGGAKCICQWLCFVLQPEPWLSVTLVALLLLLRSAIGSEWSHVSSLIIAVRAHAGRLTMDSRINWRR